MPKIKLMIKEFKKNEIGATAIEYGLIISLIVLGALSAMTNMSDTVIGLLDDTMSTVSSAVD